MKFKIVLLAIVVTAVASATLLLAKKKHQVSKTQIFMPAGILRNQMVLRLL